MTDVFTAHFPVEATTYCRQLWQYYGFNFRVVGPRRTRLGDFRVLPHGKTQITVNTDLSRYAFLITYVHEVAHAEVNRSCKRRMQPHGKAWQTAFQRLMQPLMNEAIFPIEILRPLRQYMIKPGATTSANPALLLALRLVETGPGLPVDSNRLLLSDVPEGDTFQINKKTFVRGTLRRTRVVCKEVSSGKSYAILAHAWVEKGSF